MSAEIIPLPLSAAAVERVANYHQRKLDYRLTCDEIGEADYVEGCQEIERWAVAAMARWAGAGCGSAAQ